LRRRRNSHEIYPYWDLVEPDGSIDWIRDEDAEAVFNNTISQVARNYLGIGKTAIFLSGGIDSVSIAATTMQEARAASLPSPLALSLIFPDDANEEEVQRGVAERLELSQYILPLYTAVGSENLVGAGIELSRHWSRPVLNTWWPAYQTLALEAKGRGCEVVLTGSGGDKWLAVNPIVAADFIQSGNVGGLLQLIRARQFAYDFRLRDVIAEVLWTNGFRAIAADFARRTGLREHIKKPRLSSLPSWLGATPELRAQISQRRNAISLERDGDYVVPTHGFYVRAVGHSMDNAWTLGIVEHFFEAGLKLGVRFLHPYWDPDLIRVLIRMSPEALLFGRRTKGLVRNSIAKRFPELSFRNQRKITSAFTFGSILLRNGLYEWRKLGGAPALAELGVVNPTLLNPYVEELLGRSRLGPYNASAMWLLLTLEAWLQSRV
jgi:asparagine synthetase B (glutamine-hydrolysing)